MILSINADYESQWVYDFRISSAGGAAKLLSRWGVVYLPGA